MEFENREIPEGINVSEKHPLRDIFSLSIAILVLAALLAAAVGFGAGYLARYLPFFHRAAAGPEVRGVGPEGLAATRGAAVDRVSAGGPPPACRPA